LAPCGAICASQQRLLRCTVGQHSPPLVIKTAMVAPRQPGAVPPQAFGLAAALGNFVHD
jgi:hypothetical protein